MQIILEENEIMEALNAYCSKNIIIPEGKKINVDFTVGRGGNGTRATIDFVEVNDPQPDKPTPKKTPEPVIQKIENVTKKPEEQVNEIIEDAAKEPAPKVITEPDANPEEELTQEPDTPDKAKETDTAETPPTKDSLFNF